MDDLSVQGIMIWVNEEGDGWNCGVKCFVSFYIVLSELQVQVKVD